MTEKITSEHYFMAENLQKTYLSSSSTARKINVSFFAEKGSFTSILGPSGSGKSTVLKLIAGFIKSDDEKNPKKQGLPRKKIILDGVEIGGLKPSKREIGMVFQNGALFPNMTVEKNIAYGLKCRGIKSQDIKKEVSEFLEKFNLSGFENRMPETLSGGEAQRVSLARTLIVKPKLVLFDEPLSALDTPLRKKLANEIKALQSEFSFTAIMVTHDIEEAKYMSDRIIAMRDGCVIWEGNASDYTPSTSSGSGQVSFDGGHGH